MGALSLINDIKKTWLIEVVMLFKDCLHEMVIINKPYILIYRLIN